MGKVRAIVVGTGGMSRHHMRRMLERKDTLLVGCVETSDDQRAAAEEVFKEKGRKIPPFRATLRELLREVDQVDAALIGTPHKFHCEQARDCLQAGMDVLLEKPMVINAAEARRLIRMRDQTGRVLVVAFPGSLSPAIRKARTMIEEGELGTITSITAHVHQNWKIPTTGTWRQNPSLSGGGFLFDTGSHMTNTVIDLIGSDVTDVTALLDNRGTPVEIVSAVSGRTASGVFITLTAAGDSVHCNSQVMVMGSEAVLRTGIWGELLEIKRRGESAYVPIPLPESEGVWAQFLKVRAGKMVNPCPPETGLRFASLMDMIHKSAETGRVVHLGK